MFWRTLGSTPSNRIPIGQGKIIATLNRNLPWIVASSARRKALDAAYGLTSGPDTGFFGSVLAQDFCSEGHPKYCCTSGTRTGDRPDRAAHEPFIAGL
jgi:hypothetical protein